MSSNADNAIIEALLKHIHDLNNALASAEGFTFLLSEEWPESDENGRQARNAHAAVEQAMDTSDKMFQLCQQVKNNPND